jgi:hypothetical protein
LVKQWHTNRLAKIPLVKHYKAPAAPFARKYTALDIDHVCGPVRYVRLAKLSSSHLYNLYQHLKRVIFHDTAGEVAHRAVLTDLLVR